MMQGKNLTHDTPIHYHQYSWKLCEKKIKAFAQLRQLTWGTVTAMNFLWLMNVDRYQKANGKKVFFLWRFCGSTDSYAHQLTSYLMLLGTWSMTTTMLLQLFAKCQSVNVTADIDALDIVSDYFFDPEVTQLVLSTFDPRKPVQ